MEDEGQTEPAQAINQPVTPEDWLTAALLDMVAQHCSTTTEGEFDSYAISANAAAMRLLAEAGFIEIESEFSRRVFGHITPKADALIERIEAAKKVERLQQARQMLGKSPDVTPAMLTRFFDITMDELMANDVSDEAAPRGSSLRPAQPTRIGTSFDDPG